MSHLDISTEHCLIAQEGRILTVTLNRPEKKNAFTSGMIYGLYRAWRRLAEDKSLYCAILTANGDTFSAGMDLKAGADGNQGPDNEEMAQAMKSVPDLHWQALLRDKRPNKPLFLAVEGYALAGGTEILQGTDIRVAAEDATFGVTEVIRGLYPMAGSAVRLRRQIPYCLAAEMLLIGGHFTAEQALRFGLVNRVVPKGEALTVAREMAETLCKNGPVAIEAITRTLREIDESFVESDAMLKVDEIGWPVFATKDAKEGMTAFKEKRPPVYVGE